MMSSSLPVQAVKIPTRRGLVLPKILYMDRHCTINIPPNKRTNSLDDFQPTHLTDPYLTRTDKDQLQRAPNFAFEKNLDGAVSRVVVSQRKVKTSEHNTDAQRGFLITFSRGLQTPQDKKSSSVQHLTQSHEYDASVRRPHNRLEQRVCSSVDYFEINPFFSETVAHSPDLDTRAYVKATPDQSSSTIDTISQGGPLTQQKKWEFQNSFRPWVHKEAMLPKSYIPTANSGGLPCLSSHFPHVQTAAAKKQYRSTLKKAFASHQYSLDGEQFPGCGMYTWVDSRLDSKQRKIPILAKSEFALQEKATGHTRKPTVLIKQDKQKSNMPLALYKAPNRHLNLSERTERKVSSFRVSHGDPPTRQVHRFAGRKIPLLDSQSCDEAVDWPFMN